MADSFPGALPETIEACHQLIGELAASQSALLARLAELEERLKLDSRNSSRPPSSDGPGRSGKAGSKPPSTRKRGVQPGHEGHHREAVPEAELDHVVQVAPPGQCSCGGTVVSLGRPYRHQVFELPHIKPAVTEYRLQGGRCLGCGGYHRAPLPAGVPSGQLGPRVLALVGTLAAQCQVTQNKMPALLSDVFGIRFSVGCLSQAQSIVADALAPVTAQLHQALLQAPVIHMDETSHRSHGHLMWIWTVATAWGASFHIEPSRGKIVARGILQEQAPTTVLVTDRYAAYQWVDIAQRQICWSHLIRDFRRISQRDGLAGCLERFLLAMAYLVFRYRHAAAKGKTVNHA